MTKVYVYVDESGDTSLNLGVDDTSSHFILTVIRVPETEKGALEQSVEKIRKDNFQNGEIKSSKVGKSHNRRKKILKSNIKYLKVKWSNYTNSNELNNKIG